jgi:hypothetical protein
MRSSNTRVLEMVLTDAIEAPADETSISDRDAS